MRLVLMILVGLGLALPARAALCPDCRGRSYTKDIGECSNCKEGHTTSGQFKLCGRCSAKLQQCEHCRKPLPAATTQPGVQPIDPDKDGKYIAGAWEYRYTITGKGTRSQGYVGELLYGGKPVAEPKRINDYYQTPWGPLYWVGKPVVQFGAHGWMIKPKPSAKPGKQLPDPGVSRR